MVDFVDLAESSRWLLERALSAGKEETDDFVNLEMDANAGSATAGQQVMSSTSSNGGGYNDNILYTLYDTEDGSYTSTTTRPLLSKSAEAEIYLLATNFLLYVAMVIITTLVAKIYFPQSLERGSVPTIRRKYSYRRQQVQEQPSPDSLEYADEEEDEMEALYSDDEGDDDLGSPTSSGEVGGYSDNVSSSGHRHRGGSSGAAASSIHHSPHRDPLGLATTNDEDDNDEDDPFLSDIPRGPHSTVLEFDQQHTSRTVVVRRLLFCSLMLNLTFVSWGLLQERMLTRRYPRHTGEYFTYSYALVFTNRFWTLCFSALLLFYLKPRLSRSTVIYEYSFPSISNMLSSWCQYEALRYVSFPATTLFKSFKLAPVMLMGKILGNKTCEFFISPYNALGVVVVLLLFLTTYVILC
jgi:UAA transporter family